MKQLNARKIRFILLPSKDPPNEYRDEYNKIYTTWKDTWSEAYNEIGITKPLYSDSFSRQDEIAAIFYDNVCVAMSFVRFVNFEDVVCFEDSVFKAWSKQSLKELCHQGTKILVASNGLVVKDYRKAHVWGSWMDMLILFMCRRLVESNCDAMGVSFRAKRGMRKRTKRDFITLLDSNSEHKVHGEISDLIAFYSRAVKSSIGSDEFNLVNEVWERVELVAETSLSIKRDKLKLVA